MLSGSNAVAKESPQSPGGLERSVAARLGAAGGAHGTDSADGRAGAGSPAEPAAPPPAKGGMSARAVLMTAWRTAGIPLVAIAIFLLVWSRLSAGIETSLGRIPGPTA